MLRRAAVSDAPAVARLWSALVAELDPGSADGTLSAEFADYLSRKLGSGELVTVVDEEQGALQATASAILIEVPPRAGTRLEAYVINVFAHPGVRGQGRGEAVMVRLLEELQPLPVRRVLLRTAPKARGLYLRLGFSTRDDWLVRDRPAP